MANERQLVRIPQGPAPATGIAQMMPGARGAQRSVSPVRAGRVRLSTAAPNLIQRGSGVLQDGGQLAQGEAGKARAAMQVGNATANAIESVGNGIFQIDQRIRRVKESAALMEQDADLKGAWNLFQAGLPADPDQWDGAASRMIGDARAKLDDPEAKHSRALKRKLEANFKAWESETKVRLGSMATAQNLNIAKAKIEYAEREAIERGDFATLQQISAQKVASGLSTPELESLALREAGTKIQRAEFGRLIETDPFQASDILENVNLPWMTPDDKLKAAKSIRYSQAQRRAEEADGIANALAERPDMPESDFRAMLDQSNLEPVTRKKFEEQWKDDAPPDFKRLGALRGDILKLSRSSDWEEVMKMRERIASETRSSDRGMFMQYLNGSISDGNQDQLFGEASNLINATVEQFFKSNDEFARSEAKVLMEAEYFDWRAQKPEATREESLNFLKTLGVELASDRGVEDIRKPGVFFPPAKEVSISTKQAEVRGLGFQRQPNFFQKILSSAPPENTYQ